MKFIVVYDPHFSSEPPHSRKDDFADSMFRKLDFIRETAHRERVSFVMFAGDVSHKKVQPTAYVNQLLTELRKFRCPLYTVVGNHDVYAANVEFLDKTTMGTLISSGVLLRAAPHFVVDDLVFWAYDYAPRLVVAKPPHFQPGTSDGLLTDTHIAFAHGFLTRNQGVFEADDYLDVSSFIKAGYRDLFVGHDHMEYMPFVMTLGDGPRITVYRGGSLSRGTKLLHNQERTPKIHLAETCDLQDDYGIRCTVESIDVPCLPASEVFAEFQMEREDAGKAIQDFVKSLQTMSKVDRISIYAALDKVCDNSPVKKVCHDYLADFGFVRE